MFDVDSKDRTLGISCPPPAFIEVHVLESVKASLKPEGLVILDSTYQVCWCMVGSSFLLSRLSASAVLFSVVLVFVLHLCFCLVSSQLREACSVAGKGEGLQVIPLGVHSIGVFQKRLEESGRGWKRLEDWVLIEFFFVSDRGLSVAHNRAWKSLPEEGISIEHLFYVWRRLEEI